MANNIQLAFALDCTGSMHDYINSARNNIKSIADELIKKNQAELSMALVTYRDHKPMARYLTQTVNFTRDIQHVKSVLDGSQAHEGGDEAEAVADALHELNHLSWSCDKKTVKICVLITDAPAHGLAGDHSDYLPRGCPFGHDPVKLATALGRRGIRLYVVGCEPSIKQFRAWFASLATTTGGQYLPLRQASILPKVIVGGAQEELFLQSMFDTAQDVVNTQSQSFDELDATKLRKEIKKEVDAAMKKAGKSGCLLRRKGKKNVSDLWTKPDVCAYAECSSLEEARGVGERAALRKADDSSCGEEDATVEDDFEVVDCEDIDDSQADRLMRSAVACAGLKDKLKVEEGEK